MKVLGATLLFLFAIPMMADSTTGQRLLDMCTSPIESSDLTYCLGYLDAAIEFITLGEAACAPSSDTNPHLQAVNLGQYRLIVIKWMQDNPETLHENAAYEVMRAVSKAFPCRNIAGAKR